MEIVAETLRCTVPYVEIFIRSYTNKTEEQRNKLEISLPGRDVNLQQTLLLQQ